MCINSMYYEHVLVRMHTLIFIDYPQLGLSQLPPAPDLSLNLSSYSQELTEHEAEQSTGRTSLSMVLPKHGYTKGSKLDEVEEPF